MCQQTIAIRQDSSNRNATSKILGEPNAHPWLGQRTKSFYSANPEIFGQPTIFSASLQDPLPANHSAKFQHVQANEFDLPTSKILAQPNVIIGQQAKALTQRILVPRTSFCGNLSLFQVFCK